MITVFDKPVSTEVDTLNEFVKSVLGSGVSRNGFYRGKNLGTLTAANIDAFCETHKTATGEFDDLFLGDYFTIQDGTYNKEWMIAAFDLDYGNTINGDNYMILDHHFAIIPKGPGLIQARMHPSDDTSGGIANAEIRDTLQTIRGNILTVVGDHAKKICTQLSASVDSTGKPLTYLRGRAEIRLLTQVDIFGHIFYSQPDNTSGLMYRKLPIYNFIPRGYCENPSNNSDYWLADIYDGTDYRCMVRYGNSVGHAPASTANTVWVRPMMAIG